MVSSQVYTPSDLPLGEDTPPGRVAIRDVAGNYRTPVVEPLP